MMPTESHGVTRAQWLAMLAAVGFVIVFARLPEAQQATAASVFVVVVGLIQWPFLRRAPDRLYGWMRRRDGRMADWRYLAFVVALAAGAYAMLTTFGGLESWVREG